MRQNFQVLRLKHCPDLREKFVQKEAARSFYFLRAALLNSMLNILRDSLPSIFIFYPGDRIFTRSGGLWFSVHLPCPFLGNLVLFGKIFSFSARRLYFLRDYFCLHPGSSFFCGSFATGPLKLHRLARQFTSFLTLRPIAGKRTFARLVWSQFYFCLAATLV